MKSKKKDELIEFLRQRYPNVFEGEKLNIDKLKRTLKNSKERGYELNFVGKNSIALKNYNGKIKKNLKFEKQQSKNPDNTNNMIIRGDNLEVLKILKNDYTDKIKMIYIDPPYNTKNDKLIYFDNFKDNEYEVLKKLKLSDDYKTKYSHNGWLIFMYPRLKLAKDLLKNDGVIFISIDDNEQANLKLICDEIFGEENFISCLLWLTKKGASGMPTKTRIVNNHEYILCYAKNKKKFKFNGLNREENDFFNPDNDSRGLWKRQYLQRFKQGFAKKTIIDPKTKKSYTFETPYTIKKINAWIEDDRIIFPKNGDGYPAFKEFYNEYENKQQILSFLDLYSAKGNTEKLIKLFDGKGIFNNPKPDDLVGFLIEQATKKSDIILDFFAGSGTTAQSVMELNKKDDGDRRFILVQIDEVITDKNKTAKEFVFENKLNKKRNDEDLAYISDITIERVNRAGDEIKMRDKEAKNEIKNFDIGYKVFSVCEK
ncbi:MAG: site-specific DNA-methyltransferase [Rickettsiales bacterium]|jgi:adenine-specific DNA-methyltransferase|nr:site-specific DNA-methyltransferase [Rickettsiales bacterium]